MTWNGLILAEAPPKGDSSWTPPPLGDPQGVCQQFERFTWDEEGYGRYEGDGFAIELNASLDESLRAVSVRVVGDGAPLTLLAEACSKAGWVIYDVQEGDCLDLAAPNQSWERYAQWRDDALAGDDAGEG